jgi:hypothetical protein
MHTFRYCASIASVLALGACAENASFRPISPSPGQTVEAHPETGRPYVKSLQPNSGVVIQQVKQEGFEEVGTLFDLKVKVKAGEEIAFGISNIKVRQGDKYFPVMGFREAQAKVKRIENTKQALNMFAMVLGGVAAGYGMHSGGTAGVAAATMFPATAVAATRNIRNSSADVDSFTQEGSQVFLQEATLRPREELGALFAVEGLSPSQSTFITVMIGEDVHEFTFHPTRA